MRLTARPGAALRAPHQCAQCRPLARRHLQCRAQQTTYQAPSYRTAATELDALERWSVVVPDTGALGEIQQIDDPKAATVSSAVLTGILRNPAGQQELKARKGAIHQLRMSHPPCCAFPCDTARGQCVIADVDAAG